MKEGQIIINGNVGLQLGSEMKGGKIKVNGNASSWIGMEMQGGIIEINGNAGDYIGCAYRGNWRGMKGGKIIINGNAGNNVGGGMVDGIIHIKGNVGNFCGIQMKGGEIIVDGNAGRAPGAEMVGGKIQIKGKIDSLLPGFKHIETLKIDNLLFMVFEGDLSEKIHNGKLMINKNKNMHIVTGSVPRKQKLTEKGLAVIYNSGSTIKQGEIIKGGKKLTSDYIEECARCYINPSDLALIGNPKKVVVECENRKVVLKAVADPDIREGTIFIPRSIWANVLTPSYTESTGSPMYKGVLVYVRKASSSDKILSAEEVIESMGGK